MKKYERKEDAASPVIGVMLMLVVTVVIAAVITAFATGMAGDSTTTTPMALFEAENQNLGQVTVDGNSYTVIKSFDLVHKGGDEMKLENLQVIIEPIGESGNTGIILKRTGTASELNTNYENDRQEIIGGYNFLKNAPPEYLPPGLGEPVEGINIRLIETSGTGSSLSVLGKTGEDIAVSTGDRIRVPIKTSAGGIEIQVNMGEGWMTTNSAYEYSIPDEGDNNDISPGILVKWTLSDTRTNGVIAKGEFVVPEP